MDASGAPPVHLRSRQSSQPKMMKKTLAEIWSAEDNQHARAAVTAFADLYGAKFPKTAAKVTDDVEELLALYD
jgi:transposase-like protein